MKSVLLVVVGAFIGASLLTTVFLRLCLSVTHSRYCMPRVDWLAPLFPDGGASGVFGAIWLQFFVGLIALSAAAVLLVRNFSK